MKCKVCGNIPLIGIEFNNKTNNILDILKIHSFCIFNHDKNEDKSLDLMRDDIFKNSCDYCKNNSLEYLCLECKRNICKKCADYHKSHNLYANKKYLFTKNDITNIKNNFNNSKKIINENISSIQKKIDLFKSQLKELEILFNNYKDINVKIISLTNFIIDEYTNKFESKLPIPYPIHFNMKNVLHFNIRKLEIEKQGDLPIKIYSEELLEKIKTGFYFLIKNSYFSANIKDYTNQDIINFNLINIEKFKEIELKYTNLIFLNKNRLIGIDNNKGSLEIYNIQNKIVESSIRLGLNGNKSRFLLKDNLIIIMTYSEIYFLNSKNLTIIQKIILNNYLDSEEFIYIDFLSENTLGIIYQGDLDSLLDKDYFIPGREDKIIVINHKYAFKNPFENSKDYIFMLIYNKNDSSLFELVKIIALVKRIILVKEVSYVTGKHWEYEEDDIYYKFYFDSLNQISENKFIISFKCRVKLKRDLYYFYVNDKEFTNETIYYILNIDNNTIEEKLCSSTENTQLIKDKKENKFYFFFNESQQCSNELKKFLNNFEFIGIKISDLNIKQFYIDDNTLLGWNNEKIYYGIIYHYPNYKFEMIKEISKNYNIVMVEPNINIIVYNNNDNANESFNDYVKEEDNDKDSYEDNNDV